MKNELQKFAETLTNAELATLLIPYSAAATRVAEQSDTLENKECAFILAAIGLRLASL